MNEDELRERLRRINPVPDQVPMETPTTPSARTRLEHIMNTDTTTPSTLDTPTPSPRRARWSLAAAAAVLAAAGLVAVNVNGSGDSDTVAAGPPLELSLGEGDAMASCLALDVNILAGMSPAFAATATSVDNGLITLDVDHWYTGGDAATVELHAPADQVALLAGFDFEVGQQYLITASEGTVNYCGYSGPATPELTALFDQAFAG